MDQIINMNIYPVHMNEDGSEFGIWSGIWCVPFVLYNSVQCIAILRRTSASASYAAATEWAIASQEIDICQLHLTVAG